MPTVSVVIPTYNHGRYIAEALDSVLAQTYKDYEVIVVDDGSTDNTREVVEAYGASIRYIYQQNQRMSAARNAGIRSANGEYIAFLDSDDIWLPEKLEKQMEVFSTYPNLALVSCGALIVDMDGNLMRKIEKKNYINRNALMNDSILKNIVPGGGTNAVVSKRCFEAVGLFDESIQVTAEDWDMWLRIIAQYEIRFVEEPLAKIRLREKSVCAARNVENMLPIELRMLDKFFSRTQFPFNRSKRRMAYAQRYYSAALAYMQNGNRSKALIHIVKSMLIHPFYFARRKECWVLLLRITLGEMICKPFVTLMKKGITHVY